MMPGSDHDDKSDTVEQLKRQLPLADLQKP